jgi:hypothetical protein
MYLEGEGETGEEGRAEGEGKIVEDINSIGLSCRVGNNHGMGGE